MSKVLARCVPLPKLSRFGWLMGLYAENHARLQRLFEPADLACGGYVSSIGDGLDLRIDVLARHAYTVELRMSYGLVDPQTGLFDPSANLRLYNDARQVEATHCYAGRRWQDVIGMFPPRAGDAPAAGADPRPPAADEHLPRQVAAIPGRAGPRRGDVAAGIAGWHRNSRLTHPGFTRKMRVPFHGAIAQLGERLHGMQEVGGSIPPGSTNFANRHASPARGPSCKCPHRLEA